MHNGVLKHWRSDWFFNDGGGNGLGFNLQNQTLPEDKLNLNTRKETAYSFYENFDR
jgi:cytochrome c peroxidase